MHPSWVPSVDGPSLSAPILMQTDELYWFEQKENYAARVLNASSVGSHFLESITYKRVALSLYEFCTDASKLAAELVDAVIRAR